jgi:flagellar biosynthesis component FlhA
VSCCVVLKEYVKNSRKRWLLSPPVHIRDNLELKPSAYRIALKGVEVGAGEAMNGQYLAINPGMVSGLCRV